MKIIKAFTKTAFFVCLILDIAVFGSIIYLKYSSDWNLKMVKGETLSITSPLPVTAVYNGTQLDEKSVAEKTNKIDVDIKLFGVIPITKTSVEVVDELHAVVLGNPFGMKLYTKGALVVDMTDIETNNGKCNPAKDAGIEKGDYILSVDGNEISTNEDLIAFVENSGGKSLKVGILKNDKKKFVFLTPVISKETGTYKIGLWVRDSSAGIGTLTFYNPATNIICGLGHGICDEDTGELLTVNSGEILSASIFEIEKGESGKPGQLKGKITNDSLGEIKLNCQGGVYSYFTGELSSYQLTEIALKREVQNGEAQILCTIEGDTPQLYDCKISIKKNNFNAETQNMVITITDEELLAKTGGIVQGLSGTPIIQNGKLIGAVTHVLVDDPTRGYAIFAENMLETARSVEQSENLKDAG